MAGEGALRLLIDLRRRHARGVLVLGLKLQHVDARGAVHDDLGDAVAKRLDVPGRVVALDDERLAVLAEEVEVARLQERVLAGVGDVDELDRPLQRHARLDAEEHAVEVELRVERDEGVVVHVRVLPEVGRDHVSVALRRVAEAADMHALWQPVRVAQRGRDHAVDDDERVGVEAGDPVVGDVGRTQVRGGTGFEYGVVVAEGLLDVRVLPRLVFPRRNAEGLERDGGAVAEVAERIRRSVRAQLLLALERGDDPLVEGGGLF